jgi:hypothetical protein
MTAKLTARDAPDLGPGWRVLELDCDHGTTQSAYKNGDAAPLSDTAVVRVMLLRHYDAERCNCTRKLRRRYGAG